jgi:hypothetical protein
VGANTHGLDLRRGRAHPDHSDIYRVELSPADLMSAPRRWTELDYLRFTRVDVGRTDLLFTAEKGRARPTASASGSSPRSPAKVAMSTQPGGTTAHLRQPAAFPGPLPSSSETGDEDPGAHPREADGGSLHLAMGERA